MMRFYELASDIIQEKSNLLALFRKFKKKSEDTKIAISLVSTDPIHTSRGTLKYLSTCIFVEKERIRNKEKLALHYFDNVRMTSYISECPRARFFLRQFVGRCRYETSARSAYTNTPSRKQKGNLAEFSKIFVSALAEDLIVNEVISASKTKPHTTPSKK